MDQLSAAECRVALYRLGWSVAEEKQRAGWHVSGHRLGAAFVIVGGDRERFWRNMLEHALRDRRALA